MKVAVIGAGIGGLGVAALLGKDGHDVTLIEKNETVGGRCNMIEEEGYFFDTGPSWYLMPDIFENYFNHFDKTTSDLIELVRLNPQYRIILNGGDKIDITGNLETDLKTFEEIEPGSSKMFLKYLDRSKEKYEISVDHFLYQNYNGLTDFIKNPSVMKQGRNLDVFKSMDSHVKEYFQSELMQQIVQYSLVFLGGSPKNTPALYSLMTHIDFNLGVWYPKGGMYELIKAIRGLCEENGVEIITDSPVTKLVTENGKISEVEYGEQRRKYDIVISNADYYFTERLLDKDNLIVYNDKYWEKKTQAPSAFLMFLGVKGDLPQFIHHNLFFGENWIDHFEQIFNDPQWPQKPSIYVSKTSDTDNTSPEGYENLVLLTPIPVGLEDTPETRQKYRDFLLKYLKDEMSLDLTDRIVYEKMFTLNDYKKQYNSYEGTALGLAHTLFQSAVWRPNNVSKKVENLFFVGGNTNPGIGVPICLISSSLAKDRIDSYISNV